MAQMITEALVRLDADLGSDKHQVIRALAGIVGDATVCYDMAYGRGPTPFTLWAKSLNAALASRRPRRGRAPGSRGLPAGGPGLHAPSAAK